MIVYVGNSWSAHPSTTKAYEEQIRLDGRLKAKIEEIQTKDLFNVDVIRKTNKLLRVNQEFHEDIFIDLNYFNEKGDVELPTFLDNEGFVIEQKEWKYMLVETLSASLEDINDEDKEVENTKTKMNYMYFLEYTMRHLILNVNTYKSQEYIDHLGSMNLFIA